MGRAYTDELVLCVLPLKTLALSDFFNVRKLKMTRDEVLDVALAYRIRCGFRRAQVYGLIGELGSKCESEKRLVLLDIVKGLSGESDIWYQVVVSINTDENSWFDLVLDQDPITGVLKSVLLHSSDVPTGKHAKFTDTAVAWDDE